jgi:nucleotide-binding universal stress UspA family protein
VLVGIDDSPESVEAARQAATLANGPTTLLAAYDLTDALAGGGMPPAPVYLDEEPVRERAEESLARATREVASVEPVRKVGAGRPWEVLLDEIERGHATLVAVGGMGRVVRRASSWARLQPSSSTRRRAPCWSRGRR